MADSNNRNSVVIAIITVVGTLGAGLIANWDKVFGKTDGGTPPLLDAGTPPTPPRDAGTPPIQPKVLRLKLVAGKFSTTDSNLPAHLPIHVSFGIHVPTDHQLHDMDHSYLFARRKQPTKWEVEQGNAFKHDRPIKGYWIFPAKANHMRAWQCKEGELKTWSQSTNTPRPYSWELFEFEFSDASQELILVKSVYFEGKYVYLKDQLLRCDGERSNAQPFNIEFSQH